MRNLRLLALGLAMVWMSGNLAIALDISKLQRLIVFGDSLSDNGNSLALAQEPLPPYFKGRWSNGPNWVDYFPSVAGHFPPVNSYYPNGGTNFAVGGSTSADLAAEIAVFLAAASGKASATDLYVIWIGANDPEAAIQPKLTVKNIRAGIVQLAKAGAKNFVIINVPDISLTPAVIALGTPDILATKEFVVTVDVELAVELPLLAWLQGLKLDLVDINELFIPLILNPHKFGFTNSAGAALNLATGKVVLDPNDYVFWDGFHPTTRVHRIAAEFICRSLRSRCGFPDSRFVPFGSEWLH